MLPDFPEMKKQVDEMLSYYIQSRIVFHLGFMGQVPRIAVPEGRHNRLIRADGTIDDSQMKPIGGKESVDTSTEGMLDIQAVLKKLDSIAEQIATQQARHMYKRIEEVTEKTGNVLKTKMSKTGLGTMNDMLEKVQIDFDKSGKPHLPTMVCGKELFDRFMAQRDAAAADTVQKSRMEDIIVRKREEYRDRESRRRLVD